MRKTQFIDEKGNLLSPTASSPAPSADTDTDNRELCGNPRAGLYSECIGCPDFPRHCNGPKLAAFLDIMLVRDFHRRIRDHYGITNKQIADKTHPFVSKGTVAEYFSKEEKDFLWTTVAYIDYAIISILRGSEIDQTHDNPCPASSTKIQEMMAEKDGHNAELRAECDRLKSRIESNATNAQKELDNQRNIYERMIDHVKRQLDALQTQADSAQSQSADYLARIDDKNALLDRRREEVFTLNRTIIDLQTQRVKDLEIANAQLDSLRADHRKDKRRLRLQLTITGAMLALSGAVLMAYLIWDMLHIGAGLFF